MFVNSALQLTAKGKPMIRHDRSQGTFSCTDSLLGVCLVLTGCSLFGGSSPSGSTSNQTASSGVISTYAGGADNGNGGFSGDGGQATSAQLSVPGGLAVDTSGNVFIADTGNNRIRKVTPAGIITTVAGNGTAGYSGDGGQATSAEIWSPSGVAVDTSGDLFIADIGNCRIRKVTTAGVISTYAGSGNTGTSTWCGYKGDGGQATSAWLNAPRGVAVDGSGNIYIAEYGNQRVRKVNSSGVITTLAGNGTQGFAGDGGAATAAELDDPSGVAVDSSGNIYIADQGNYRIRKVNTSGGILTLAGDGGGADHGDGGPATSATLSNIWGVGVDSSGNVYIAGWNDERVRVVSSSGIISTFAGDGYGNPVGSCTNLPIGDGCQATLASLYNPEGVASDANGNVYISDTSYNRVRKVNH